MGGIREVKIREAGIEDLKKIAILLKQVYIKTYGVDGVSDEFANFITEQFSIQRIHGKILDPKFEILVAVHKDCLVGVLEVEFDKSCPVDSKIYPEINKLYILEWFCGMGIGQMLMKHVELSMYDKGYRECWVWLLETNSKALNFYLKNGFDKIGSAPFQMEKNTYTNTVMKKSLLK